MIEYIMCQLCGATALKLQSDDWKLIFIGKENSFYRCGTCGLPQNLNTTEVKE